jgi:mutator protein MutT
MAGEKNVVRVGSSGIIEDGEGKILMALRGAEPVGMWVFPGGGVEFGETAAEAFVREAREETGFEIEEPSFIVVFELIKAQKGIHRVIFFHRARLAGGEMNASDDVSELRWMSVAEIMEQKNLGEVVIPVLKMAGYLK